MVLGKLFNRGGDARLRKLKKLERKATDLYIKPPDRQYYMDQLRQEGSTDAAMSLLRRFTVSIENTTVDRDEKEMAANFLVSMTPASIPAIKKYLKTYDSGVNWPFRALKELLTRDDLVAFLIEILDEIGPDYVREPERKEQMILTAREYPSPEMLQVLLPYLDDDTEPIRFAATETVLFFNDEAAIPALEERLREEESRRIKTRLLETFVEKEWKLTDVEATEPLLPEEFKVIRNRTIKKRG